VILYYEKNPDKALEFFKSVLLPERMEQDDPPYKLSRYLKGELPNKPINSSTGALIDLRKTFFAINKYERGERCPMLKEISSLSLM
jgi:hypothetical protein